MTAGLPFSGLGHHAADGADAAAGPGLEDGDGGDEDDGGLGAGGLGDGAGGAGSQGWGPEGLGVGGDTLLPAGDAAASGESSGAGLSSFPFPLGFSFRAGGSGALKAKVRLRRGGTDADLSSLPSPLSIASVPPSLPPHPCFQSSPPLPQDLKAEQHSSSSTPLVLHPGHSDSDAGAGAPAGDAAASTAPMELKLPLLPAALLPSAAAAEPAAGAVAMPLDGVLPRVVAMAVGSGDRALRVAASELLHACVVYMVRAWRA